MDLIFGGKNNTSLRGKVEDSDFFANTCFSPLSVVVSSQQKNNHDEHDFSAPAAANSSSQVSSIFSSVN
jgi:hypothetical protein